MLPKDVDMWTLTELVPTVAIMTENIVKVGKRKGMLLQIATRSSGQQPTEMIYISTQKLSLLEGLLCWRNKCSMFMFS